MSDLVVDHARDSSDFFVPQYHAWHPSKSKFVADTFYCVVPFHPLWARLNLAGLVADFMSQQHHQALLCDAFECDVQFKVAVSWSLRQLPVGDTLVVW